MGIHLNPDNNDFQQALNSEIYVDVLKDYNGEVILVGINYDKNKRHTCKIEKVQI